MKLNDVELKFVPVEDVDEESLGWKLYRNRVYTLGSRAWLGLRMKETHVMEWNPIRFRVATPAETTNAN